MLVLHKPVALKLKEPGLSHYRVLFGEDVKEAICTEATSRKKQTDASSEYLNSFYWHRLVVFT